MSSDNHINNSSNETFELIPQKHERNKFTFAQNTGDSISTCSNGIKKEQSTQYHSKENNQYSEGTVNSGNNVQSNNVDFNKILLQLGNFHNFFSNFSSSVIRINEVISKGSFKLFIKN